MLTPRRLARAITRRAFESPFTIEEGTLNPRTEKHRAKAPSRGPNTAEPSRRRSGVINLTPGTPTYDRARQTSS